MIKSFSQPCVSQRLGGEVDVCCRDPNYKDPWPEQEQAREESRALGGDEWRYHLVQQSYNFRTS